MKVWGDGRWGTRREPDQKKGKGEREKGHYLRSDSVFLSLFPLSQTSPPGTLHLVGACLLVLDDPFKLVLRFSLSELGCLMNECTEGCL